MVCVCVCVSVCVCVCVCMCVCDCVCVCVCVYMLADPHSSNKETLTYLFCYSQRPLSRSKHIVMEVLLMETITAVLS